MSANDIQAEPAKLEVLSNEQIRAAMDMAAKAAGGLEFIDSIGSWIESDGQGNRGKWWDPLKDDGDALRLAVRLQIDLSVRLTPGVSTAISPGGYFVEQPHEQLGACAATRLAIVRVAASLGCRLEKPTSNTLDGR